MGLVSVLLTSSSNSYSDCMESKTLLIFGQCGFDVRKYLRVSPYVKGL